MKAIDIHLPVKKITNTIKVLICVAVVAISISFYLSSCKFNKSEKKSRSLCAKDNVFNLLGDCPDQYFRQNLNLCTKGKFKVFIDVITSLLKLLSTYK